MERERVTTSTVFVVVGALLGVGLLVNASGAGAFVVNVTDCQFATEIPAGTTGDAFIRLGTTPTDRERWYHHHSGDRMLYAVRPAYAGLAIVGVRVFDTCPANVGLCNDLMTGEQVCITPSAGDHFLAVMPLAIDVQSPIQDEVSFVLSGTPASADHEIDQAQQKIQEAKAQAHEACHMLFTELVCQFAH